MDKQHRETDKILESVEKGIAKRYKKLAKKLKKMTEEYFDKYAAVEEDLRKRVENGQATPEEYATWRNITYMAGDWNRFQQDVSEECTEANKDALKIVLRAGSAVYVLNRVGFFNRAGEEVRRESPNIYNSAPAFFHLTTAYARAEYQAASAGLIPRIAIPAPSINETRDRNWHERRIYDAVRSGINRGRSIPDIAAEIQRVAWMDDHVAIRTARTLVTGIQNTARIEGLRDLEAAGVDVKKIWLATLDERTRESHRSLDGEQRRVEETFSNGLMMPGDQSTGDPAEFMNCRCTLDYNVMGTKNSIHPDAVDRRSRVTSTYEQWKEGKR